MKVLRFYPQIRSAHFETQQIAVGVTIYLQERGDFEPQEMPDGSEIVKVSRCQALRRLAWTRVDVLELPEPLWLDVAYFSLVGILVTRARDFVRGGRTRVVAYCIENAGLDRVPRVFENMPRLVWRLPVRCWAGFSAWAFDALAFGTEGAFEAYLDATPACLRQKLSMKSRVITQLPSAPSADPSSRTDERQPGSVLFVGGFEQRKGFDRVLEAWRYVCEKYPEATLELIGYGPLEVNAFTLAKQFSGVSVHVRPPRTAIVAAYQRNQVCVLPSQPMHRWREQVGLPIVEAVSYGCSVVTTNETGLASWLLESHQSVLDPRADAAELAEAILKHLEQWRVAGPPVYCLPEVAGRDASQSWLLFGE